MRPLLILLSLLLNSIVNGQAPIVSTDKGKVQGYVAGGIQVFKGIPFAKPPVGDLRWRAPQPMDAWKSVRPCSTFAASPMQASPTPFMYWSEEYLIPKEPIGEDCLYLNVWTASLNRSAKKAVLVYIYGGGFQSGGAGCPIYDGTNMAKKDIVFVSINYRVGTFGFLVHPELSKEAPYHASGNYALLDMIAALQWVKRNIASFGGDPERVTIAGQSAGAFAVNFLCASPLAKGLFQRAIAESGASILPNMLRPKVTLTEAENMGVKLASSLGANSLKDLRSLPAEMILKSKSPMAFPVEDGYVLPNSVHDIYMASQQNDVPLIMGWNGEDRIMGKPLSADAYQEQIRKRFGDQAGAALTVYPGSNDEEAARSQSDMNRDETFGMQVYSWARIQTASGKAGVYVYNFNRKVPAYTEETAFGAFHTGEVPYAYDNLYKVNRPYEETDRTLSSRMSSYWVHFTKTGDPNGAGLPTWPAFDNQQQQVLILDSKVEAVTLPTKNKLNFLEGYYRSLSKSEK